MDWHETFKRWAKAPSDTEEAKAGNAASQINDALRSSGKLTGRTFSVYSTGSYRNNTNIRLGSDVDIAVVLGEAFWYTLPPGTKEEDFGIVGGVTYGFDDFRKDVGAALAAKFGADVTPGNKTFDIRATGTRLPADVSAFLLHRHYTGTKRTDGSWDYHEGVEMRPRDDAWRRIVNWHEHHYTKGVTRNDATKRRFKRVTRILKKLRGHMLENGTAEAKVAATPAASFLIECLTYNAPNSSFNLSDGTYFDDVRAVIAAGWHATKDDVEAAALLEVSERKRLVGNGQPWSRADANAFLLQAWQHVGFK